MDSFGRLGLSASIAEALLAGGVEVPTALQELAVPVIRRGTSCVLRASPGAGLLVTWGAPLLDRIEPGRGRPGAVVLALDPERARGLALSLARIGSATGHRIGALGTPWVRPAGSDILFSTPGGLERGIRTAAVKTDAVRAIVVDGASAVLAAGEGADRVAALLPLLGTGHPQVVLLSDPVTEPVRRWVDAHMRRAVFLPAAPAPPSPGPRGTLRVVTLEEEVERVLPGIVARSLSAGSDHVLLFARSYDRAADLGDLMALCGATVGRPGDHDRDVWLGVDPLEARELLGSAAAGEVAVISTDVPADVDELERRHRSPGPADAVLASSRELPHLRRMAGEAGYTLTALPASPPFRQAESDFRSRLEGAIEREDLAPYLALIEPLVRTHSAVEVAAALAALLRKAERAGGGSAPVPDGGAPASEGRRPPAWTRLFLSVGKRDGVQAGDVLGAVTGEAGVAGREVGRIEIRDAYTRIEVHDPVAGKVLRALNGSSIRGRSVRADYDRGRGRGTDVATRPRRGAPSPKSGG
ncbi:MAG: DEAD/DEAH box helicase [Gammaproteobacteria bacterium]|nr:DEAD/DEAH box helicase [Gammaproteobacteria bacterium]MDE0246471.1 DEAD/DEAH box helicase [Gammaproteobacteria bacterium]